MELSETSSEYQSTIYHSFLFGGWIAIAPLQEGIYSALHKNSILSENEGKLMK